MGRKNREGIVYSTNPDFVYESGLSEHQSAPPPEKQLLYIWLDSKSRKGKTVTLIKGFTGAREELEKLAAMLKKHCGSGGAVKDGEILIQGNFREKIVVFLTGQGYRVKKAGG